MSKSKNIVIGALVIAILAMSVGYAALARQLTINGTANLAAEWNIEFTGIETTNTTGATVKGTPTATGTSATFNVELAYPGASATFEITAENKGTIDAYLEAIGGVDEANKSEPTDIVYTVTGVKPDDTLNHGESHTFVVKVEWVSTSETTELPAATSKTATITLDYKQKTTSTETGV